MYHLSDFQILITTELYLSLMKKEVSALSVITGTFFAMLLGLMLG